MVREGGRTRRRYAVLGLVIAMHVGLVALMLAHQEATKVLRESPFSLLLLTPSAPVSPQSAASLSESHEVPSATTPTKRAAKASGAFAISLETQTAPFSADLPLRLGVDWDNEASTVANSQAASIFKELRTLCDAAAKRGEPPPPGCRRYKKPPPWDPEPNKFGLTDGPGLRLPYMRLGRRCVIGLGFFGCGIGKLPEANGHVFDDFRDPDRPWSSVPDPNDPD